MECCICFETKQPIETTNLHDNHFVCSDCFDRLIEYNIYECPLCKFVFRDNPNEYEEDENAFF